MNNLKKYFSYINYALNNIVFFLLIAPYTLTHLSQIEYIKKFTKKNKGICIENNIPWLTYSSIEWLEKNLKPNMNTFEWGSGGSTIFFAKRVNKITSIEHDNEWYKDVSRKINDEKIVNCDYNLIPLIKDDLNDPYSKSIQRYPNNSFDLIIVDGKNRNECIFEAKNKLKAGGILLLDNSERKEYTEGINSLNGWKRTDFFGPGPYNYYFWQTSIFIKP